MTRDPATRLWRSAAQFLFGSIGLALLTFVCFRLGLDLATTALAYLTLIVLLSLMGSFTWSAILSIAAVVCLNYLFVPPLFHFRVDYPLDVAALTAFLTSSLVVSGLMTRTRRLAEAAIQREEAVRKMADLLDLTHDTVFVRDMNGVITYWNRGAEERYGWVRAEAVGKVSHQLMQTIFPLPLEEINAELLRVGRWEGELTHQRRDGTQIVVSSRWALQRDDSGVPVAVLETNNDITERKRAEEALRRSETHLAEAQRLTHTGSFARNAATMQTTYVSEEYCRLFDFDRERGVPSFEQIRQRIHPEDRDRFVEIVNKAVRARTDFELDVRAVLPDGTIKYVHSVSHPVFNASGDLVEYVGTVMDVTGRKLAERERERLLQSEREALAEAVAAQQRFRDLVNSVEGIVWEADVPSLRFSFVSQQAERVLGYPVERWLSEPTFWQDHLHQDDRDWAVQFCEEAIAEMRAHDFEYRMIAADGRIVWLRDIVAVVVEGGRTARVRGVMIDTTKRRQAETAMRDSERRYRYIFESTGVSIWEEDFSRVKAALDDLKSKGVCDFRQYFAVHPEFVQQAISMVKIVNVNDVTVKLFAAESKDELLVSLHKIFVPETEEVFVGELIALAEGRTSFEAETVLQTVKGERLTVVLTMTLPPPPAGFESVLVTVTDITDRKRSEEALRQAQTELAHVARLTTLGELTASIAHEVNQPLAAIVTNGEACLRFLGADESQLEEARSGVQSMINDGVRASEVVHRLRALSRKADLQKAALDVNDVINDVVLLVQRELQRHRVSLRLALTPDLPPVLGDRVQLQQVIMNLAINAIEAMASVTGRPRDLVIGSQQDQCGEVRVVIQDSGIGIAPENMERLFNAFFSTKPDGMGMGLSICRSIIEAHGGRIWASRNVGPGVSLHFALPVHRESTS
jgi:PAS domain S-box-containing protein